MQSLLDHDREVLRPLAEKLRSLADRPEMTARAGRIARHNGLKTEGPLIFVFPEGAWEEILPASALLCRHPFLRTIEEQLRQRVFTALEIRDDSVEMGTVDVPRAIEPGSFGVEVEFLHGEKRGSYAWKPPFTELHGITQDLKRRTPVYLHTETARREELVEGMIGDILTIKPVGSPYWSLGMTWKVIDFIGMELFMIGMIEEPEEVHLLMGWMMEEQCAWLDQLVGLGALTSNNGNDYCGSGGFGFCDELNPPQSGPAPLMERWGFAESQETVGISPEMFAEFILPYQLPILERFGLNHYGCCEPLDGRWEHVKKIPRLRRVSVSPWANEDFMAEALTDRYVYSRKPSPVPLCVGFDESALSQSLDDTLVKAEGCVVEFVMKDTHTVQGDRSRFGRWVDLARERVDKLWR